MEISKHVWTTSTRPCLFCLCLQGGSVFADFDVDADGRVYLVRISFDRYGCCPTESKVGRMAIDDSRRLLELVNSDNLAGDEIRDILYRYFAQNQKVIWPAALAEYRLLKP